MRKGTALIVGVTGISGYNLANTLVASGWTVYGLARKPVAQEGVIPVAADLLDAESTRQALAGLPISHVFFCTWTRRAAEKENVEANGAMMDNLCQALDGAPLEHLARKLVDEANRKGGEDNISVVVVRIARDAALTGVADEVQVVEALADPGGDAAAVKVHRVSAAQRVVV